MAPRRVGWCGKRGGLVVALLLQACQISQPPPSSSVVPPTPPARTAPARKTFLTTGTVIFEGLTPEQLADFRVIPETGTSLFTPRNERYDGVDGFWWRERRGQWFKIPGGTVVRLFPHAGPGSALAFDVQTEPAAAAYLRLKGSAAAPGWHRDAGATAHPTDDPF